MFGMGNVQNIRCLGGIRWGEKKGLERISWETKICGKDILENKAVWKRNDDLIRVFM